jgi:hypothetical protein
MSCLEKVSDYDGQLIALQEQKATGSASRYLRALTRE